ncbi:GIY-YIG nuclease family protein [Polyangium fumosum]|uniref:GIY-YIG nuclease family protein n=1 Tax=Polyangium fumosum TaxID=889272 RepID=A0A4U1J4I9_9BACT|nr:GIY-YIG nuclease family protein [Polyangium fumosum]TKD01988.1 GIY-YIG nuclease family protein [Polyangium fumosum]
MPGRSIRLFLVDGTPQGLRTAEVGNWTGLALICPRTDLPRLGDRKASHRTGIYFLLGVSDSAPSGHAVYVGEADEVWVRLSQHDNKQDFWTWAIIFVSKDENLTKAHVRWLEAKMVRELRSARAAELKNTNDPPFGSLPEADLSDMEVYLDYVRLLLPTLGADILATTDSTPTRPVDGQPTSLLLELFWENAGAECAVVEGKFVVRKGSTARTTEVDSLNKGYRDLRRRLKDSGVLAPVPNDATLLTFTQDFAFDSPSAAAAAVTGTGLNGRAHWKVKPSGQTYREWEEAQLASST